MLQDIYDALKVREEKIQFAGREIVVRELDGAADVAAFEDDTDLKWKLLVRCAFDLDGKALFTDSDIHDLKAASRIKLRSLVEAVNRVNGFAVEDEAKNSAAAPA